MKNNAFHNYHTQYTKKLNENQCFWKLLAQMAISPMYFKILRNTKKLKKLNEKQLFSQLAHQKYQKTQWKPVVLKPACKDGN